MKNSLFPFIRQSQFEKLILSSVKKALNDSQIYYQPPARPLSGRKTLHSPLELALFIGCSKRTAHRLLASGKFKYYRYNRKILIFTKDVLKAMELKSCRGGRYER